MAQQRIDRAKQPQEPDPAKKKSQKVREADPASSQAPSNSSSSTSADSASSSTNASTAKPVGFEVELRRLETTVADLEQGDLPLEDALGLYEQGVALTRQLQQTLAQAEQKVKMLSEDGSDE